MEESTFLCNSLPFQRVNNFKYCNFLLIIFFICFQLHALSTVKDPTSDMALNSRKGSLLLREVREKKEMMKMRKRFWELGGSRMGDAMGNYISMAIKD